MKILLFLLVLAMPIFGQTSRARGELESATPPGKMWELAAGKTVSLEEKDGKTALWAGQQLLAGLGEKEAILQATEDDGWLLLRLAWKVERGNEAAGFRFSYWTYSRLILIRPGPSGKLLARNVFPSNEKDKMGDAYSILQIQSLSRKDESATMRMWIREGARRTRALRTAKLLTNEILDGEPEDKSPLAARSLAQKNEDLGPMYFPNVDVREVAQFYGEMTGVQNGGTSQISGQVTFESEIVSREKRIKIVEEVFTKAGVGIVDVRPGLVRFVNLLQPLPTADLPVITKPDDLPKAERVVTFIYKSNGLSPAELVGALRQIGALDFTKTRIPLAQADEAGHAIIFAGPSGAIRKILKKLEALDQPQTKTPK